MAKFTLYASKSAQIDYGNPNENYSTALISDDLRSSKPLLVGFDMPSEYQYRQITTADVYIKFRGGDTKYTWSKAGICEVEGDWVESEVTYNTKPKYSTPISGSLANLADTELFLNTDEDQYRELAISISALNISRIINVLRYGIVVVGFGDYKRISNPFAYTSRATDKPYIVVECSDDNVYLSPTGASPSSGYIPKYSDNTFTWGSVQSSTQCISNPTVTNTKFIWRTAEGETETTIDCGTSMSCTIPSGTFTTDSVQWKVVMTDSGGTETSSDWFTMSTVESTSTAKVVSPMNTILDASADNTFTWNHVISTGTNATKSELQISNDNSTWSDLATVSESDLSTIISANTLVSANKYWRVRTYNTDDVAGEWSDSASIIVMSAPTIQGVSTDATSRPTVKWQCADMQGYQVIIDGYDSGIQYGVIYSYKSPIYLEDGEHTAKVRVINQYGLWSDWQSVSFTITNEAGTDIELIATATEGIVSLSWSADSSFNAFIVERDGVMIAKVTETTYQDNFSIGTHSYAIRGIYDSSDNYSLSDTEYVDISVDDPIICNVDALDWMNLRLSSKSINEIVFGLTTESNTRFYSASNNPVAEISKHRTNTVNGYVAFENHSDCYAFESLIGTIVCLKLKSGEQIIGLLTEQERTTNTFFTEYRFNIIETDFDEEIEL